MVTEYHVDGSGNYLGAWPVGHSGIPGGSTEVGSAPPINNTQIWGFPGWGSPTPESLITLKAFDETKETLYTSAGDDFVPGTTNVLTMPAASAEDNKANVFVWFERLEKNSFEWNIAGTTITFTSPIDSDVTKITIRVLT